MPRQEKFEADPRSWKKHRTRKGVKREDENEKIRKQGGRTGERGRAEKRGEMSAILVSTGWE